MSAPRTKMCLLLLTALLAGPGLPPIGVKAAPNPFTSMTSRPTNWTVYSNFNNPGYAADNNVYSAGGYAVSMICNRDCTSQSVSRATWDTFQSIGSYVPKRVEVVWSARSVATGVYQNNASLVTAQVTLYHSGTSQSETHTWSTQTEPVCPAPSNQGIACPDHVTTFLVDASEDISTFQVEARMTVQMTTCSTCTSLGNSNVSGNFSVYDIRLIADSLPPEALNLFFPGVRRPVPVAISASSRVPAVHAPVGPRLRGLAAEPFEGLAGVDNDANKPTCALVISGDPESVPMDDSHAPGTATAHSTPSIALRRQ